MARRRKRFVNPVPHEGEDGLFTQSWYPICRSSEVSGRGAVLGADFLDGRVVVFRGENGLATVASAYCPHVGADLSQGDVRGNNIRCPFHFWEFDQDGWCSRTGVGDPPPKDACLFLFPSREKHGLIWAFNGERPLFELPYFDRAPSRIRFRVGECLHYANDPWTLCSNSPDYFHFHSLHRLKLTLDLEVQSNNTRWWKYGMAKRWSARLENGLGDEYNFTSTVVASNLVLVDAIHKPTGLWTGVIAAQTILRPQRTRIFPVAFTEQQDDEAENKAILDEVCKFFTVMGEEDIPLLDNMRYIPGRLTRHDALLMRYLRMIREFPRAHPSADFIRKDFGAGKSSRAGARL